MIRKDTLEKIFWLLIIVTMGLWGAVNMLQMEHESYASDGSSSLKVLLGLLFVLTTTYIVCNYKYLRNDKIGIVLIFLSIYLSIARIAMLPNTASLLSYIYQPLIFITNIILYLCAIIISNKSDELRSFITTWIIIGMLIIAYFYLQNWGYVNSVDEYHSGGSYWILFLLPVLLYSPKKWLHYFGIILVVTTLFSSFKRGGLLAFGVGIIVYLIVKEILIGRNIKTLLYFCIALCAIVGIFLIVDNAMGNIISERFMNIKEDGGSNRTEVWATTWNMIQHSDAEYLLFGHGFNSVLRDSPLGLSAHNDFLESIYDFGIFGSIFYFLLHISLIKQIIRNVRLKNKDTSIMAFTYTFFFVLSMISHVLIYPWFTFIVISWGLGSASEQKALQKSTIQSVTLPLINA